MDKKVFYFKEAKDIFIETLNKLNENDRLLEQQKNMMQLEDVQTKDTSVKG